MKKTFVSVVFVACGYFALGIEPPSLAPLPNFDRRAQHPASAPHERAASALRARMSDARVDRDPITQSPKWIGSTERFLTGPDGEGGAVQATTAAAFAKDDRHRAVKAFLNEHREIFGHDATALGAAKITREDVSPTGLRTVVWQQSVDEIPVFEGILKAGLTPRGELVNIGSHFVAVPAAAALAGTPPGARRITAQKAVALAAREAGAEVREDAVAAQGNAAGADSRQEFKAPGLNGATAQLTWLPTDAATLRLCWKVTLTNRARGESFRVLIDAQTGAAHIRHCLTEHLSDASYRVFTSDSPTPMSPGFAVPTPGQPPVVPRSLVTTPALNSTASPNGWIDDGVNETRGNNVDAHTDVDGDDQPDLPRPQGSPARVFDFPIDLAQDPNTYRNAAVTNLFYWCNRLHDRYYELGFTEAAGNFQNDTFGRGGAGNDAINAQAQDGATTNNASMTVFEDGIPARIEMYVFDQPSPRRDGDLDAEVIIHEFTHGLSNRLVGGGVGISALQSAGMGEGWSDFYALCVLSEVGDDVHGNYAAGAYASYLLSPHFEENYYFGIRRYPYSTDLAKSPLTFKDIDDYQASPHTDVPRSRRFFPDYIEPSEVHNQGEVWCTVLWEARANLIDKIGPVAGNNLILQLVTNGMKLAPANPNFLQARDAIIQADLVATAGANRKELWAAFAKRGMGLNATSPDALANQHVFENYDALDDLLVTPGTDFAFRRNLAAPFAPAAQTYRLKNVGTAPFSWTASKAQPWLTLNPASGTLAPGASVEVTATLDAITATFDLGDYTDLVKFRNAASSVEFSRAVSLSVDPPRAYYFPLDTDPGWTRTGEWAFGQPTGGGDTPFSFPDPTSGATGANVFGVNLAGNYSTAFSDPFYLTTGPMDLRGRKHTRLQFQRWLNIKSPATIEVSTNGITWTEIWNSREISKNIFGTVPIEESTWNRVQYDISSFADNQPAVFFRWSYSVFSHYPPLTGWNIDDIEILGAPDNLAVTLPAALVEGNPPAAGTVTANHPVVSDLVVFLTSSDSSRLTVPASVTIPAGATSAPFAVVAVDDAGLNGSESVSIKPYAPSWAGDAGVIAVHDNETATLSITLPASAPEYIGKVNGNVTVSAPPASDVLVQIISSAPEDVATTTVTIPAGQTSVPFQLSIIDDNRIDDLQNVTVTANVVNWTSASTGITIIDDEDHNLVLEHIIGVFREGDGSEFVDIRLSGTLPTDLVVTLASDDTTEITVPATVTIPAGTTSGFVDVAVIDDAELDGIQTVHISASAPGFVETSLTVSVLDNDVHHFSFDPIVGPKVRGLSFPVRVTAKDINDEPLGIFTPTPHLSASNGAEVLPVAPAIAKGFVFAVWDGYVVVNGFGSNVVLTVSDGKGHTGSSNAFAVATGPFHHFAWNVVAPQVAGAPSSATARAMDVGGNFFTGFTGLANLSAAALTTRPATAVYTTSAATLFGPSNDAVREQIVYFPNQLGGAGRFTALEVNVIATSQAIFNNFTIRLKHTAASTFNPPLFETGGWTVVHVSNAVFSSTGSVTLPFQTPFDYDGNSNLLVDLSWHDPTRTDDGPVYLRNNNQGGPARVVIARNSVPGTDPTLWTNENSPNRISSQIIPVLRFTAARALPMLPATTGAFVDGVWSGNLSILTPGAAVSVRADAGVGHVGDSASFLVTADADGDGLPDAWAAQYGVHGAFEDPEGDGLANLVELALGLNPTTVNVLPPAQLVTDPGDGLTYLTWQYHRLLDPGSLTYIVEASDDLLVWHTDAGWVQQVGPPTPNADSITETVTVRALPDVTATRKRFLRLRVMAP